jgi:hypothetical protein
MSFIFTKNIYIYIYSINFLLEKSQLKINIWGLKIEEPSAWIR